MPRKPKPSSDEPSITDLGALAAKKNFDTYYNHPYTEEPNVAYFDFRYAKGNIGDMNIMGSDEPEVALFYWNNDIADMGGGDDVAVGLLGDDTISGGGGNDYLFGDTDRGITNGGSGDNDILLGDSGNDVLVGDAPYIMNGAQGGQDTLNGGTGDDILWGDGILDATASGGADEFVFAFDSEAGEGSGMDVIQDFRLLDGDVIKVVGYAGISSFTDLESSISDDGIDTTIDFGNGNQVVLVDLADHEALTADDFVFA